MSTSKTIGISLFILSLVFVQIMSRPQSSFDSQEIDLQTSESAAHPSDIRKFFQTINDYPNYSEDEFMNRLQLQLLNAYAKYLQSQTAMGGAAGSSGSLSTGSSLRQNPNLILNDNSKGISEQKRHPRYRQCYFNPISCFKK